MANSREEKRREQSERLADTIKEQERRREEIKFKEEWNKRIDIAREGRVAYENDNLAGALGYYRKILALTARHHNVAIENLSPKLFDEKNRISESLLISAIALDLAKIVERLQGDTAKRDLKTYLRLFVVFSKGMPFEVVSTSTLRKYYMFTRNLRHRGLFEDAYKQMKRGWCFVATVAYGDENATPVIELRRFRDEVLRHDPRGRSFIRFYYRYGRKAAAVVKHLPLARAFTRAAVSCALPFVRFFTNRI